MVAKNREKLKSRFLINLYLFKMRENLPYTKIWETIIFINA